MSNEKVMEDVVNPYQSSISTNKTLEVTTIRIPPQSFDARYIDFSGVHSAVKFSEPVRFDEELNKGLVLKMAHFSGAFGIDQYWGITLDNEGGYAVISRPFNLIKGTLPGYSKERLKSWQEDALKAHRRALGKIEKCYWEGKPIPEGLFAHLSL